MCAKKGIRSDKKGECILTNCYEFATLLLIVGLVDKLLFAA